MAYFCKIGNYGIVEQVIVINDVDMIDENGNLSESIGQDICVNLYGGKKIQWIQTWMHGPRGTMASKGFIYNYQEDKFYPPQPSSTYVWSEEHYDWLPG